MIRKIIKFISSPFISILSAIVFVIFFSYTLLYLRENRGAVMFLLSPLFIILLIFIHKYVKRKNPSHVTKTFLYFVLLSIILILILPIILGFILGLAMFL